MRIVWSEIHDPEAWPPTGEVVGMDEHWKTCGICGNWTLPEHEVSPGVWLCEVCHGGVVPLPRRPLVERERIGLVDDLETLLVIYILESMLEAA